jgi:hypothetical protein
MAKGFRSIPSKSARHRHDRRNHSDGKVPAWVCKVTHGKFGGRGGRNNSGTITTTPENLPNLRVMPTGIGPGQVFLHDPRA